MKYAPGEPILVCGGANEDGCRSKHRHCPAIAVQRWLNRHGYPTSRYHGSLTSTAPYHAMVYAIQWWDDK